MTALATVSVLTVTYNAIDYLADYIASLSILDLEGIDLEFLVIDNGSTDGTQAWISEQCSWATLIENDQNNYSRALNIGIESSVGEFVVIANNDASVDPGWLQGLLCVIRQSDDVGAVQSKILFHGSTRLNSVGVEEVARYYLKDIGFGKKDSARYAHVEERNYITGGSVMFRRCCLDDVGKWDEEFVMFVEDVDYSERCRRRGWRLLYSPHSVFHHHYHGSSSKELCEYFCTRNRFLFIAKHFPLDLAASIPGSHFFRKGEFDNLYRSLLHSLRKMCSLHDTETVTTVLEELRDRLPVYIGEVSTYLLFSQLELLLGKRRVRIGIYDHAGHLKEAAQRNVAKMAEVMQHEYDITYIFNDDVQLSSYSDWFAIDLSHCTMKVIRIPFFEHRNGDYPDEALVVGEQSNPFDIIARDSLNYDVFINASMVGNVNPLAAVSLLVCHFRTQDTAHFSMAGRYDYVVIDRERTGEWVRNYWQLEPTHRLFPPQHQDKRSWFTEEKEKLIVSVFRRCDGDASMELEVVNAFREMCSENPDCTAGWRFVLVVDDKNIDARLRRIESAVGNDGCSIEIRVDASANEIAELYRRAAIFWQAGSSTGARATALSDFEMATLEAMHYCCAPVVANGHFQRMIVDHGECGYCYSSMEQLQTLSLLLMEDPKHCRMMAKSAYARAEFIRSEVFNEELKQLLNDVDNLLSGTEALSSHVLS